MHPNFAAAIKEAQDRLQHRSSLIHTEKWQGVEIQDHPEMATYEVLNYSFTVPLGDRDLQSYREDIKPNLPWADNHFDERVCGQPINPGKTWEWWPYAKSAAGHLDNSGRFNHNYMERYWPKYAGIEVPTDTAEKYAELRELGELDLAQYGETWKPLEGIYHPYGDLSDVVDLLVREPQTRQAYLPVFFPEDTGARHGGRLPCSLGYHFIQRGGFCHIIYYLRSCDFVRHFRDDIYLTLRLLLWVVDQGSQKSEFWRSVRPGLFTMHITSLHMFRNDYINFFGKERG